MLFKLHRRLLMLIVVAMGFAACQKETLSTSQDPALKAAKDEVTNGHLKQTNTFSSEVVKKWLQVQSDMLYRPVGNPFGLNPGRYMAYMGVALYESVAPGMPAYQSLQGQLNEMPAMPGTQPGVAYYWPASAHAALATLTKKFYGATAAYNADAVNALETELNDHFRAEAGDELFDRSAAFGTEVANRIFEWAKTDNSHWPTTPYQLPSPYPGMWQPETAGGPIGFPYWGYNRTIVPGSIENTESAPPPSYSTDPASPYYAMYKEVYDVSQHLTQEQKMIAKYYNDANPGYPAGAHYIVILKEVLEQFDPALDKAALTYAKTGMALFDGTTASFKAKYKYMLERPFQYIRTVIAPGTPAWKPYIPTPPYPDFPSNHALFAGAVIYMLNSLYGDHTAFTNSAYEGVLMDLGNGPEDLGSRSYSSFDELAGEIGMSRLYGGIHVRYSIEEGAKQGRRIAANVERTVHFLK